jgi:hypothetical protein
MPTKYSHALIEAVQSTHVRGLGQELALLCIHADLPAAYVAQVLGVSRMTLHTWFRGGEIRERKHVVIEAFMKLVKEDIANGVLPAKTFSEARSYLQTMCDEPIRTTPSSKKG